MLSLTLSILLLSFYHPEWGYPGDCIEDKWIPKAYGFPLPYFSKGPTSLNYMVMPHILLFNIIILMLPVYAFISLIFPMQCANNKKFKFFISIFCIGLVDICNRYIF